MLANCTWFSTTSATSSYEAIIGTHIKWLNRLSLVICEGSVRKANKSEPIKTLPRCQQNSHNNCRCCQKVQNCPNMVILRTMYIFSALSSSGMAEGGIEKLSCIYVLKRDKLLSCIFWCFQRMTKTYSSLPSSALRMA